MNDNKAKKSKPKKHCKGPLLIRAKKIFGIKKQQLSSAGKRKVTEKIERKSPIKITPQLHSLLNCELITNYFAMEHMEHMKKILSDKAFARYKKSQIKYAEDALMELIRTQEYYRDFLQLAEKDQGGPSNMVEDLVERIDKATTLYLLWTSA